MDSSGGIGQGFDALRVLLAYSVVYRHCFPITYGPAEQSSSDFLWSVFGAIVPIFFAVSGFLVMGSAARLTLWEFNFSRVLRILPALAVDTVITIILAGLFFTTLSTTEFFSSSETWQYLGNILGIIQYDLPGVFEENPLSGVVNGSLWTIKPELVCYLLLAVLISVRCHNRSSIIIPAALLFTLLVVVQSVFTVSDIRLIKFVFGNPAFLLVPTFLLAGAAYNLRRFIPYNNFLFSGCVLFIVGSGFVFPPASFRDLPLLSVLAIPVYIYIALFLGVTYIPLPKMFKKGDYSYGIYLYAFPIQQALVEFLNIRDPNILFLIATPCITAIAMISWHYVEKPLLRFRKSFSMAAKMHGAKR